MKTLSRFLRHCCWGVVAAMALQAPLARAELLGPEAAAAASGQSREELDRAKVLHFLESASLQERMRTLGVDGLNASARVKAMTQEEVHALAQRIDSMPAGGALSDRDIIIILLVTLLLVVVL